MYTLYIERLNNFYLFEGDDSACWAAGGRCQYNQSLVSPTELDCVLVPRTGSAVLAASIHIQVVFSFNSHHLQKSENESFNNMQTALNMY
uniref:Uncharacterized protein n=1 Tax=Magallana gigas TaxID=29159 RepID=K1P862_MAGGI